MNKSFLEDSIFDVYIRTDRKGYSTYTMLNGKTDTVFEIRCHLETPFSLDNIEYHVVNPAVMARYPELLTMFHLPEYKGDLRAAMDMGNMDHYRGNITLPESAFTNENDRLFFQGLINRYRRHIVEHITDDQRAETMRDILRQNNEKRRIYLEPLIPEIERFIRQYRRDNPGANIKEILNALSEHLETKKGIRVSVPKLRKQNIHGLIRRIAQKEKSGKV